MNDERQLDTARHATLVAGALREGRLKVRPEDEAWVAELLNAPRGVTGLVDTSGLSERTLVTVRATGDALASLAEGAGPAAPKLDDPAKTQCELFRLFETLFGALTGCAVEHIPDEDSIRLRILERFRDSPEVLRAAVTEAEGELRHFYSENATGLFTAACSLGGLKAVGGGQRAFTGTTLTATRIAGLYLDTQLIPDPVVPFVSAELHLNAALLQLARVLYHLLQLKPIVDAQLPVPPVFVFPSFEEGLEARDAHTQAGLAALGFRMLAPCCAGTVATLEEVLDYAAKNGDAFGQRVVAEQLFLPPNVAPGSALRWPDVVATYFDELRGVRSETALHELTKMPPGVVAANAVLERLRPQYHLMENAHELHAQPFLSQAAHWHYFERCATSSAKELVNKRVISEAAFMTLKALQDDSLSWLAKIPVSGLLELRQNHEHEKLRDELKKYTAQLSSAEAPQLSEVIREVNHGLSVLIQKQAIAIREIEDKYRSKKWGVYAGAAVGAVAGGSLMLMPSLAPLVGVVAPLTTALGAIGGGGREYAKERAGKVADMQRAQKTLVGMLATARR